MNIQIESPHYEPRPETLESIEQKFNRLGKKYERIENCSIVLKKEKNDLKKKYFVEARLQVPGTVLFASERDELIEVAIDKLLIDLEHQLTKYKEEKIPW
jgi:ribosomal subunit interface protein